MPEQSVNDRVFKIMDHTLVVDAAACIPKTFFSMGNLAQIPQNPTLYDTYESIPSLLTNAASTTNTVEELLEAYIKEQERPVLYFRIDDGFTHANLNFDSKLNVLVAKHNLQIIPTNQALMGCGWQAIHASELLQQSGTTKEILDQTEHLQKLVQVVAFIEHPELLSASGSAELSLEKNRIITNIIGSENKILRRIPARNEALVYFRDYCTDQLSSLKAPRIVIHHATTYPAASALEKWIKQKLPHAETYITSLTRQATAKFGPRMLAMAWYDAAKV